MIQITVSEILARGLGLPALPEKPCELPAGTVCAITGAPITAGYPVADIVTDATNEFLDCFRCGVDGWVSESAARCFKANNPHGENKMARAHFIFEDGAAFAPMIARESAEKSGRPCWSSLAREVWPARRGQRCVIILTTDTKKRLWPRARVGALGERTPVFLHDSGLARSGTISTHWERMLEVLDTVERIYSAGFAKAAIGSSLLGNMLVAAQAGIAQTFAWERELRELRKLNEFNVALLIAQRDPAYAPVKPVKKEREKKAAPASRSVSTEPEIQSVLF